LFNAWDRNGNGTIDEHELFWGLEMENLSLLKAHFEGIFQQMDVNGDGKVDFEEFETFVKNWDPHHHSDAETHGFTLKRSREKRAKHAPRHPFFAGTMSLPQIAYTSKYR
jgi:hypothetical protein